MVQIAEERHASHNKSALEYYARNREKVAKQQALYYARNTEKVAAYHRKRYERFLIDLRALKLLRGCTDCGYDDNGDALQFDHLPGTVKKFNLGRGSIVSGDALVEEINKCEVVCSNCHSIRTATRRRMI